MNQWGEEDEYDRAKAKSERRNARMAKYRVKKEAGAAAPEQEGVEQQARAGRTTTNGGEK